MAQEFHMEQVLQWLTQPAFWVEGGVIRRCNSAAEGCLLQAGEPVLPLLHTGQEEYVSMEQGCLHLTLQLGNQEWNACIQRMEAGDLFQLESTVIPELQAMSLASAKLREPLTGLIAELNPLLRELPDGDRSGRISKRMHQMLRILGNMSAGQGGGTVNLELRDVSSALDELFEKTAALAESLQLKLEWSVPNERIYSLVDMDRLERAVYHMLSNAMKASAPGGRIFARLTRKSNRLCVSILDMGSGIQREELSSVYTRYLRAPGLETADQGIGLGMHLITSAARLHGGTVLLEAPAEGGTRITISLPIRIKDGILRSSSLRVDYAGGWDHALIELSDVLPAALYSKN